MSRTRPGRLEAKTDYWNHNAAYHDWIVRVASQHHGSALDVGCGEGLLIQRLASVSTSVAGIDPDHAAIERARQRTTGLPNVKLEVTGFLEYGAPQASLDIVTFVASLHHMDLVLGIRKARSLLRRGGDLLVVGLSANKTPADWISSGLNMPLVRLGSWMHHETRDVGVMAADPHESLVEIKEVVRRELPGARMRRGLYYRYLMHWTNP
jgi:2-polyprenyl-3-methyl-5-hydroxy-6-metoxy-1,4-benzoquinol methylase